MGKTETIFLGTVRTKLSSHLNLNLNNDQSYKATTIAYYNSRVVYTQFLVSATLDTNITIVEALQDRPLNVQELIT